MTHPMLFLVIHELFKKLPVLINAVTCHGKFYIVTGANVGLGLETARYLVKSSAAKVIFAVRNLDAGKKAKTDIEQTTGRSGVVKVWQLDLGLVESMKAFAQRSSTMERINAFVANAGVFLDQWTVSDDGTETSMKVNVISTMLLAIPMMPKLVETARKFGINSRLVFRVSALGFTDRDELAKGGKGNIFDGLNKPQDSGCGRPVRLPRSHGTTTLGLTNPPSTSLTKLVEMYAVREMAAQYPVEETGGIINMTAPGLCSASLGHDASASTRAVHGILRIIMVHTAEEGSRTLLHGIVGDENTHGKHLSGCEVKEHRMPSWMTDEGGQRSQKQLWKELVAKMESVQPGCTTVP